LLRKLTDKDFKVMPWKNGKGTTTELYRIDVGSEMAFRVSTAKVEHSGPFSDFSGYDRTLVNLGPSNMQLAIDGQDARTLAALEHIHFDGGAKAHCEVRSPCDDLNFFCRKEQFFASTIVRRLKKPEFIPLLANSGWFLFVVSGRLCAHGPQGRETLLGPREVLIQDLGGATGQDRLMLASASEDVCVLIAVSFRQS
jgi:environmental stress-induced protein Ves